MAKDMKFVAKFDDQVSKGIEQVIRKIEGVSDAVKRAGDKQADAARRASERLIAETDRAEKQRIALQRASISQEEKLRAGSQAEYQQWWQRQLSIADRAEKQRIALQRNSLAMAEAQQARESQKSLQANKYLADSALRIERQAAQAEASLVVDRFDRRIAVERAKHAQILADLKGNDAAQEAEIRRHNAVVGRIQMDKANLPNTPFQQLLSGVKQGVGFQNGVAGLAMGAGSMLGATVAITGLTAAMGAAIDRAKEFNTVNRALSFAAGGARAGGLEFAFVRQEAARLGIPLLDAAQSFAQMAAAARGTTLEGKGAREVFKGITEASVSLGLSGEQTAGALNAIQQMISKGTVQSEELRGQLGERIPGAFQIAARAMNMTTAQLGVALEKGQVFADDFLPRFATELHKTFGETAVTAASEARAEIQRFNNTMSETAGTVGEVFVQAAGLGAKAFNSIADAVSKAAAAQNDYYVAQQRNLNGGQAPVANDAALRAKKLAEAQDDLDRMRRGGEARAAEQRAKDREVEEKERKKAAEKAIEDAKREAEQDRRFKLDAREDAAKAEAQLIIRTRAAHLKERDEAVKEDEKRTEQIYKARNRLTEAQGAGGSAMDKLKADQAIELQAYAGNEAAKTEILKAQLLERKALEDAESQKRIEQQRKERDERLGAVSGFFGGVASLMAQANMHERQNRLRWKTAAIAEATANTALAATKSLTAAPYPFNLLLMAGTVAAGLAQVNQIKDQKFARGTDYAPGGMALVGEEGPEMVYLPRGSQVKTASETRQRMGSSFSPQVTINMSPGTTAADARAIGDEVDKRLRALARDMKEIEYRGITA